MLPSFKEAKKKREKEILRAALALARKRGGECRRLSDRIEGRIIERSFDECPDVVLRHENRSGYGDLIGVEHFRVDQLLEWNVKAGKPMSAMMRASGRLNQLKKSVLENEAYRLEDDQYKELGSIIDEILIAQGTESLDGFVQAFSEAFNGHLAKSDTYRENVAQIAKDGEQSKLAFLIETHVDYSQFRCWDGYKMRVPLKGELPLFSELVELFGGATSSIDYLILAMCPPFSDEVIDARIINCASLESSLVRQKAIIVEYLGYNRSLTRLVLSEAADRGCQIEVSEDDDIVTFRPFLEEGERLGDLEVFQRDMDGFARALELKRRRKPFLATFGVSMFLELFGDYAARDLVPGTRFGLPDLIRWKNQMGPGEWRIRDARFREAHGIADELLNN